MESAEKLLLEGGHDVDLAEGPVIAIDVESENVLWGRDCTARALSLEISCCDNGQIGREEVLEKLLLWTTYLPDGVLDEFAAALVERFDPPAKAGRKEQKVQATPAETEIFKWLTERVPGKVRSAFGQARMIIANKDLDD